MKILERRPQSGLRRSVGAPRCKAHGGGSRPFIVSFFDRDLCQSSRRQTVEARSSLQFACMSSEEAYRSDMARLVVGARHWSTELLVDGGWCAVGPGAGQAGVTHREPPPRRHHAWGSALLAVALVKWGSHGPRDSKVLCPSLLMTIPDDASRSV